MSNVAEFIHRTTGLGIPVQSKILSSLIVILVIWLVRFVVVRIVWRRSEDIRTRYLWRKISTYVLMALGIVIVGRIWFEGIQSLATFVGLVAAGLVVALRDVIMNMAGWVFIVTRRPFTLEDRIQVGEHRGDVIDIRIFEFSLLEVGNWVDADQSTGRVIHIPNGKVFTEALANYGRAFQYIWNEVPVLLTFESNWRKAEEILKRIANKHAEHLSKHAEEQIKEASRRFMIFYTTLTPTVYTSVRESGVLLTIRYLCAPRRRRGSEHAIWQDILDEFARCPDIDFAYPTQRFYDFMREGRPQDRSSIEEKKEKDDTPGAT
jgi:small-conductance mechanosensitive channel